MDLTDEEYQAVLTRFDDSVANDPENAENERWEKLASAFEGVTQERDAADADDTEDL